MVKISVRSILVSFFLVSLFVVSSPKAFAQLINTPTPSPTQPIVATATPTPTVAAVNTVVTNSPTPVVLVTGPAEDFALIGLGFLALMVVGFIVFFAL